MNAGTDYQQALKHAQANADYTRTPRWIHGYGGTWWISREPVQDSVRIDPKDKPKGYC